MIIFHSREALTARLAALLYVGRLGRAAGAERAWEAVAAPGAYQAEGLWEAGRGPWGEPVFAVGRASRPEVVDRVFHGLAEVFGIAPASYLLVNVGPVQAWPDLLVVALRRLGLGGLARSLELSLLARRWPACLAAVRRARVRTAERRARAGPAERRARQAGESDPLAPPPERPAPPPAPELPPEVRP